MATIKRTQQAFPTRTYGYSDAASLVPAPPLALQEGKLFRFIKGRDAAPMLLDPAAARAQLSDPFAQLILFSGDPFPLSCRALLGKLDTLNADPQGLPVQRSFLVADGGQIPWTPQTDDLERAFRITVVRQKNAAADPDILLSTGTVFDSDSIFLQVIGWDDRIGAFQFYERRSGSWVWAGSSWDALAPDSRGNGPFDSHVNGALNMKELKVPWVNWHSMAAQIRDEVLAPGDPLRGELLWTQRSPAQDYEVEIVKPGISRWQTSRLARSAQGNRLTNLPQFFRQVLGTSTVNLVSSPTSNAKLATAQDVSLPLTFFINSDAFLNILSLAPDIAVPKTPGSVYRAALQQFDVAVTDGNHRIPGDTHFVFVVPEPAFEDNMILQALLDQEIISAKFAASLLMVDFCNPIFSSRRAALLQYVPLSAVVGNPIEFETAFGDAIRAAGPATGGSEAEFLANFNLPGNWQKEFEGRIERFFQALKPQLSDQPGFNRIFELAESRRREFRKRPLAEFRLTTPVTNIPENASLLEFTPDARIRPKP